jgi:hypothetical protein
MTNTSQKFVAAAVQRSRYEGVALDTADMITNFQPRLMLSTFFGYAGNAESLISDETALVMVSEYPVAT